MSNQKAVRAYSEADADMRQRMRTMREHFTADVAAFGSFNPNLDGAFATAWLNAIEAADAALPGTVRIGELKEDTEAVLDTMEQARQQVQTLFYYVDKAFPKNPGRLEQYGKKSYSKARKNQEQMRTLLEMAVQSAVRDELALTAQGYTPTKRVALEQLNAALTETNTAQKVKKGTNKELGDQYIDFQNAAYGYGRQTNEAARVLYMTDATKRDLYRLQDPVKRPEAHELTLLPGQAKTVLFDTALLPATELRLQLREGTGTVEIGLVATPDAKPTQPVAFGPTPDTLTVAAAQLGTGPYLWARTAGPDTVLLHAELLK